ncbi:unnamed protein product [Didymodactylos carnosus]|uniref:Uncharacterized protein n=1 Tax=Didymodactylos carnosus TaxID=1234261 RepID=A0A813NVC7_9BILA|nr:unnamed protein product [Didymodactylos carnosus]CAF0880687.1 unnamed protein product [Didymodactylos carnosus]CAF3523817.1 unnamed protein product [Didymodactylos carnosus]CAF3664381.1 unnamed protein product [Didymodactylos carnosus]
MMTVCSRIQSKTVLYDDDLNLTEEHVIIRDVVSSADDIKNDKININNLRKRTRIAFVQILKRCSNSCGLPFNSDVNIKLLEIPSAELIHFASNKTLSLRRVPLEMNGHVRKVSVMLPTNVFIGNIVVTRYLKMHDGILDTVTTATNPDLFITSTTSELLSDTDNMVTSIQTVDPTGYHVTLNCGQINLSYRYVAEQQCVRSRRHLPAI